MDDDGFITVKRYAKQKLGYDREAKYMLSVDRSINEVTDEVKFPGWEKVKVQVDSGAVDTVTPKDTAKAYEVKPTKASKRRRLVAKRERSETKERRRPPRSDE